MELPAIVSEQEWQESRARKALHITNGDATVPGLRGTGLAHAIVPWRDVAARGACARRARRRAAARPRRVPGRPRRGRHRHGERVRRARSRARGASDGEFVLWFEADLYDQLQIAPDPRKAARARGAAGPDHADLHRRAPRDRPLRRARRAEPGAARAACPTTAAATLTGAALDHAARAWAAFRAADPGALGAIAATRSRELRFLGEAFDRLSREYPSTRDGLSLTERRILTAVAGGAPTAGAAFVRSRRPGGAALPRRHLVLRDDLPPGPGADAAPGGRAGGGRSTGTRARGSRRRSPGARGDATTTSR